MKMTNGAHAARTWETSTPIEAYKTNYSTSMGLAFQENKKEITKIFRVQQIYLLTLIP